MYSTDQSVPTCPTMTHAGVRLMCPSGLPATIRARTYAPGRTLRLNRIGTAHRAKGTAAPIGSEAAELALSDEIAGDSPATERDGNGARQYALRRRGCWSLAMPASYPSEEPCGMASVRNLDDEPSRTSCTASTNRTALGEFAQASMLQLYRDNPEADVQEPFVRAFPLYPLVVPPPPTDREPGSFQSLHDQHKLSGACSIASGMGSDACVEAQSHPRFEVAIPMRRCGFEHQPRGSIPAIAQPTGVTRFPSRNLISGRAADRGAMTIAATPGIRCASLRAKSNRFDLTKKTTSLSLHCNCQLTIRRIPTKKQGDSHSGKVERIALTLYLLTVGTDSALFARN